MRRTAIPLLLLTTFGSAPAPSVPTDDAFMAPGISRELARYRAATIANVRYALTLDLRARDTAQGEVRVRFDRSGTDDVILDFRGPWLGEVRVNGRTLADAEWNGAHVRIPRAHLRRGANDITLRFTASIAPAGASIIRFHDATDDAEYLYTLLVPADANQLFPCFDQPDLKARFTLALRTPRQWTAMSNGSLAAQDSAQTHRTFRFSETEPISTYLLAFAAGPWATITGSAAEQGDPVTIYVRASRAHEVESDSIIGDNVRALRWLEEYFGTPYPFGKLDMLLAPAFPFGGMEHPGAIFYNEDRLIFRERPTLNQLITRKALIYHEVAHQWFGDLVTMEWFDDLWLKEGFATFMAARMQAALDPDTDAWKTFYLRNKPPAYAVDATAGTTPVWQELANLDQAKSAYGPIVYNKAPSVLKQLEFLVGEDAFRRGVQAFLRRHAFANATWRDLLAAIGGAADRSLDDWGDRYILQPGMPVLEQRLSLSDGTIDRLTITQRPARAIVPGARWPMRAQVVLWYGDHHSAVTLPLEITGIETEVQGARGRPAPRFVFANAEDRAYALVLPDSHSVAWLERHVGEVDDPLLRAMLWGAVWDLVRDARHDPVRYIEMALRHLPAERDEQIASAVLGRVGRALRAYVSAAERSALLPRVETVLVAGASDTTLPYGIRKPHLDALISLAATPAALAQIDALLDGTEAAGEPLRAPTRWAIVTSLVAREAPGAQLRLRDEAARDSTPDGRRRAFVAGAARRDADVKRTYFDRYLRDESLNEDWATSSLDAFNAPGHDALTLPYLRPALDTLPWIQRNRRIFFLGSWLNAFVATRADREALQQVETFLRDARLPTDLRLKVLQASDELERAVAIRERFSGAPTPAVSAGSDATQPR